MIEVIRVGVDTPKSVFQVHPASFDKLRMRTVLYGPWRRRERH
jgi:hypothetical protein